MATTAQKLLFFICSLYVLKKNGFYAAVSFNSIFCEMPTTA